MSSGERILIAGCGYVGAALAERLVAAGHRVWGLRRRPQGLPAGVVPVAADLADPAGLSGLPADPDVVVYAVAAGGGGEDGYRRAYVEGPRHLLAALERAGASPRRVLFTSSTSVYAQADGEWVDETSPTEPTHWRGRLMLEGEAVFRESGVPACILRLGGIYGPGRTRLVESVREGRARVEPGPPAYTNRIHRDDCAGALAHLVDLLEPADLYLGVDCEPAPRGEVLRWLAEQLGAPEPPVAEASASPGGRGSPGSKRCSNRRLLETGYEFAFPSFREGYASLLG